MWIRISGYEDLYLINENGDVMSQLTSKIVRPYCKENGYKTLHLTKNGASNTLYVHRLVARHFVSNTHNYNVVNHIDGDKTNSNFKNLEWCSYSHNMKHAWENRLVNASEKSRKASSENMTKYIRSGGRNISVVCVETGIEYKSLTEAAKMESIHESNINKALRGVQRTAGGYHWRYSGEVTV